MSVKPAPEPLKVVAIKVPPRVNEPVAKIEPVN